MAVLAPSQPLTERSATDLARAIRHRETTSSRDVVEAHIERIEFMHERINAVVVDGFDAARADADAADARIAAAADVDELPPFLGVPLWIETENRAYDRTHNAYSKYRTAGGSSGGEGAVVGSGGSPLGLGADIGGSIRLPAFFNGVFGLKPSPASCRAPASLRRPTPRRRADAHDRPDRAPRRGPLADEEGDGALRRGAQARAGVAVALEPERAFGGWLPTDPRRREECRERPRRAPLPVL